ncbi:MAG TPA: D-glycerate dehydrogenase [Vicinamibacterales bacterium]|nr:D-glycerate dehydrogenase [Vicinamibacterales bacterium]
MAKPSVLLTKRIPSSAFARLEEACDVDLNDRDTDLTAEELRARLRGKRGVVTLLTDVIDRAALEAGTDLEVVANIAVGYNNIDVAAARERGVVVTNTPDVLTEASADLTWALILGITRRIVEGDRLVRAGRWKGWALDFMLGSELGGKQLGIVGMGRIGRAVAKRAAVFGMRVVYTSRSPQDVPGAERMAFDRLLASSDVVSLHCPLTADTRHLIDQAALARMKRSAYLINTSRGPVVDEAALVWALTNRIISGAALDVFEEEPKVHPGLLTLENVVLVPHLGSATTETRTAMADLAVRNAIAVLNGEPPLTPVI